MITCRVRGSRMTGVRRAPTRPGSPPKWSDSTILLGGRPRPSTQRAPASASVSPAPTSSTATAKRCRCAATTAPSPARRQSRARSPVPQPVRGRGDRPGDGARRQTCDVHVHRNRQDSRDKGKASGVAYFRCSTAFAGDPGTRITASGTPAAARVTITPTSFGTTYLYVTAVDRAGNEFATTTFPFDVIG